MGQLCIVCWKNALRINFPTGTQKEINTGPLTYQSLDLLHNWSEQDLHVDNVIARPDEWLFTHWKYKNKEMKIVHKTPRKNM